MELYVYIIVALMPLSAILLVLQVNPYYALVIRGILGAVGVLVYVILGAADVALTEALVGTLLGIALYIIAIRSSMNLRWGILEKFAENKEINDPYVKDILKQLNQVISKYYLRIELFFYEDEKALRRALETEELHGICEISQDKLSNSECLAVVRIPRIYDILKESISQKKITIKSTLK